MRSDHTETDVLRRAVAAVTEERLGITFGAVRPRPDNTAGDAEFAVKTGDVKHVFRIAARRGTLSAATLPTLEALAGRISPNARLLVVADQVGPAVARLLKERGIGFMDTAGNAFLSAPGLHVWISGKRLAVKRVASGLHRQNALKVIFALLTDPLLDQDPSASLLNRPVRALAEAANVALGSVGGVFDSLRTMGLLLDDGDQRRLVDRGRLIELWATDYPTRLRFRLIRQRYRVASVLNWEQWLPLPPDARWGGDIAGARLTRHLRPGKATIYAPTLPDEWIVRAGLQTDQDGNVEVLAPFWGDDLTRRWMREPKGSFQDCVHPLIVYADLMADGDERGTETAGKVYDQYLRQLAVSD